MKRRTTRKNYRKNMMMGGAAIPYAPTGTNPVTVSNAIRDFEQQAVTLSSWASAYNTTTQTLNDPVRMLEHRTRANALSAQANLMFNKANALWKTVYGSDWPIPPAAAPAPAP